jgi:hypothetical protein
MNHTRPTMPPPPPGLDLDADFVNISPERYTKVPKSSHRDGEHRLQSLLALGVLTLYLSNKTGWKIPNASELAKSWQEGEARIRHAVTELEAAGFLVRFARQEKGRWRTHTYVSSDPAALAQVKAYAAALKEAQAAAKAAKEASDDEDAPSAPTFPQVAPDGTCRDSVDGGPVDGDPAGRHPVEGNLKNQEDYVGNQEDSVPSERLLGGDSIGGVVQPTLTGDVPPNPAEQEPTPEQRASMTARVWIEWWLAKKGPIAAPAPVPMLRKLLLSCITGGFTDEEVQQALKAIMEPIPHKSTMQRHLTAIRNGEPPGGRRQAGRYTPPAGSLDVNAHWDQVAANTNGHNGAPVAAGVSAW